MSFNELATTIRPDGSLPNSLLITQDVKLKWNKKDQVNDGEVNAYEVLESLYEDGICNEAEITIYFQQDVITTYLYYSGVIKIPSLEWDMQRGQLECTVQDNSYYAYIKNNLSVKVNLLSTVSKNKINIDPLPEYTVDLFNSLNGIYFSTIGRQYRCYRIYDVFAFLMRAITDNKVGFQSDYLTSETTQLFLTKGQSIVTSFTFFPLAPVPTIELTFSELFNEINIHKNLAFYIDATDPDNPVMRIERKEDLYGAASGVVLDNVLYVKKSLLTDRLYSSVDVGSEITIDGQSPQYTFPEATSYFGWKKESFHPLGQCNTDRTLSLVNNYVISNNVIQDALYGSTEQIDSLFLIECDNVDEINLTATAYQYDYFGQPTPPVFYNLGLNNATKLSRYSDVFQADLANFLGIGGDGFRALLGDSPLNNITYMTGAASNPNFIPPGGLTIDPSEFVNETTEGGYDGGGNYDNVNFEYTVPADGVYSFLQRLYMAAAGITTDFFRVENTITLYSSAMVLKASQTIPHNFTINQAVDISDNAYTLTAVAGDIVQASYRILYFPNGVGGQQNPRFLQLSYASYFECNGTPDGGVIVSAGDGNLNRFTVYSFSHPLTDSQYRTITANPTGSITFSHNGVSYIGWILDFRRNDQTGMTTFKLLSTNAIISQ